MFINYGLPIFDAARSVITLNSVGQPVDHIRNMVTITTADGFPNDGESPPRAILQPTMPIQVSALVHFVTFRAVRTPQALTTTPKLACTPVCVSQKIIDYETKADKALYKQAIRLI